MKKDSVFEKLESQGWILEAYPGDLPHEFLEVTPEFESGPDPRPGNAKRIRPEFPTGTWYGFNPRKALAQARLEVQTLHQETRALAERVVALEAEVLMWRKEWEEAQVGSDIIFNTPADFRAFHDMLDDKKPERSPGLTPTTGILELAAAAYKMGKEREKVLDLSNKNTGCLALREAEYTQHKATKLLPQESKEMLEKLNV